MPQSFPTDSDIFAQASDGLKELMRSVAHRFQLAPGEVLMSQGEHGDTFCALESGALEVSVISAEGRKLSLDVMQPGAFLGEITLFDPGPRTATVTALKPSRVWAVRNTDVLAALRQSPDLAIEMLQLAGRRMRWMGHQLSEQVFLPLPARLARKLGHLTAHDDAAQPTLTLSQADLAEFVGASREAVSKTLLGWKQDGIVALTRGGLRVLNRPALEKLARIQDF